MDREFSRRTFLGSAAAMAAAGSANLAIADGKKKDKADLQAKREKVPPLEKLSVALIGCGGQGRHDLRAFLRNPEVEVLAICDVDSRHFAPTIEDIGKLKHPTDSVETYVDFRRVIDRKDIDAVIIGTPDHWHAIPMIFACQAGKDIYCEKPLAHNIVEGRAMVRAARKNNRVVQIGTQQRSGQHFRDAVEYVRSGKLGKVHICRTWIVNRNNSPEGDGNPPDGEPPNEVDYNFWLGPAPQRPFNPVRFHHSFRWFQDYGNGLCNDWGVHLNDIILWAMGVQAPASVCSTGGKYVLSDISDTPDTMEIFYEYPGFSHIYTVRRCCDNAAMRGSSHGMEFQGSDGTLVLTRGGWQVLPEKKGEENRTEPVRRPGSDQHNAHVRNFIECVKTREPTASDIEAMHRATTTCHLANISLKVGRKIFWDPEAERCRHPGPKAGELGDEDAQANAYLFREPRKPWSVPMS